MLVLWVSPILLFLLLSVARGVSAVMAALLSLILAGAVVLAAGPRSVSIVELGGFAAAGVWIALPAVAVILAGLYFTEVLGAAGRSEKTAGDAPPVSARELGTICLFVGPFVETAAGFGVGYVVAVTAVLRAGKGPTAALALGAFSQCLVPWGALGVGTKIGAALAQVSLDDLILRIAVVCVPVLLVTLMMYWRIAAKAGVVLDRAQRIEDALSVIALCALLLTTNLILPIELAGLAAIGPVLICRYARQYGRTLFGLASVLKILPYLILIFLLGVTKLVPSVAATLSAFSFTPGQGAPAFAPLASPAFPLIFAAFLGCLAHGAWGGLIDSIPRASAKGLRASVLTVLLVALAWIIVRAGIAEAFAIALRDWIGPHASLVVPVIGAIGGYLTGSNTGSASLAMPMVEAVALSDDELLWIAAAAIVTGSVYTAFSPVRFAMGQAIARTGTAETRQALRWLAPYGVLTLGIALGVGFAIGG